MRKQTLALISFIILFPAVYFLPPAFEAAGYDYFPGSGVAVSGLISLVAGSVLALVLTPLNKKILAWRKSRGRDIEEEERYETEGGMIRLTPNSTHERSDK